MEGAARFKRGCVANYGLYQPSDTKSHPEAATSAHPSSDAFGVTFHAVQARSLGVDSRSVSAAPIPVPTTASSAPAPAPDGRAAGHMTPYDAEPDPLPDAESATETMSGPVIASAPVSGSASASSPVSGSASAIAAAVSSSIDLGLGLSLGPDPSSKHSFRPDTAHTQ